MGQQQHFQPRLDVPVPPSMRTAIPMDGTGIWGQPSPAQPILTFRVLPLLGPCRRTRPPSLSPSGLSSSGGIISRDATSTGREWGAGAGGLLLELTVGFGDPFFSPTELQIPGLP